MSTENRTSEKVKDQPLADDSERHVSEHDKVSFVSDDQDEGVTRIEALCELTLR